MRSVLKRLLLAVVVLAVLGGGGAYAWGELLLRRSRAALDRQDAKQAEALLDRCYWPAARGAEWHLLAGRAARLRDDLDGAERHLTECQRLEGQPSAESTLEWALLQAQGREMDSVEEFLRKAIDANHPQSILILDAMGRGYLRSYRVLDAMH